MMEEPTKHAAGRDPHPTRVDYLTDDPDTSQTPIFAHLADELGLRIHLR